MGVGGQGKYRKRCQPRGAAACTIEPPPAAWVVDVTVGVPQSIRSRSADPPQVFHGLFHTVFLPTPDTDLGEAVPTRLRGVAVSVSHVTHPARGDVFEVERLLGERGAAGLHPRED